MNKTKEQDSETVIEEDDEERKNLTFTLTKYTILVWFFFLNF